MLGSMSDSDQKETVSWYMCILRTLRGLLLSSLNPDIRALMRTLCVYELCDVRIMCVLSTCNVCRWCDMCGEASRVHLLVSLKHAHLFPLVTLFIWKLAIFDNLQLCIEQKNNHLVKFIQLEYPQGMMAKVFYRH